MTVNLAYEAGLREIQWHRLYNVCVLKVPQVLTEQVVPANQPFG